MIIKILFAILAYLGMGVVTNLVFWYGEMKTRRNHDIDSVDVLIACVLLLAWPIVVLLIDEPHRKE